MLNSYDSDVLVAIFTEYPRLAWLLNETSGAKKFKNKYHFFLTGFPYVPNKSLRQIIQMNGIENSLLLTKTLFNTKDTCSINIISEVFHNAKNDLNGINRYCNSQEKIFNYKDSLILSKDGHWFASQIIVCEPLLDSIHHKIAYYYYKDMYGHDKSDYQIYDEYRAHRDSLREHMEKEIEGSEIFFGEIDSMNLFEIDKRLAWLFLLSKNKTRFQEVFLSIPSQYRFSSQNSLLYSLYDLDYVYPFPNDLSNEHLQNFAENYEKKLKGKITSSLNTIKEIDKSNNFKNKIFVLLGKVIHVIIIVFFTMLALYAITIFRFNKKLKKTNAELVDKNKRLKMRNDEVQKLSRELSHRLKNDLLIVESILKRQMRTMSFQGNQHNHLPFLEAISSIETLRLAHQYLVTADTLGKVDTFSYFKSIIQYFEVVSKTFGKSVVFNTSLSNTSYQKGGDDNELLLPIALAIRLGRILNELLTNALKHAGKSVEMQVFIHCNDTNLFIIVSDNGIGMPETVTENFGLTMIRAEIHRLQGTLEITENHPGTKIKIVIQKSIALNYLDDHEST